MKYISTRGGSQPIPFLETLLAGLAPDGGLFLPETYPLFDRDLIASFAGKPYAEVARAVLAPFIGTEIDSRALEAMIAAAYSTFRHPAVAPLAQIDANMFVLELFHGRTLAFKDVAMQLLAQLVDHALKARGQRATIVGATSGDTGAAAIDAFRGLSQVDVFILYPHGRVSDVQRRQMTTAAADNVHALAIEGTFDDAQAAVKALFHHAALRDELKLCGVNSINWARILAQTVYYFTSAAVLGAPHRPVSFAVPTGNFGDIFAGWIAKKMGLPIDRLIVATNANDILPRALSTGSYAVAGVQATQSPSMDIQVSSNFERLLFEALGRDAEALRALMAQLRQSNGFAIAPGPLQAIRADFDAFAVGEEETTAEIARTWNETGFLPDPHTAVGLNAARRAQTASPLIVLGTAHPAKFGAAIERAVGFSPPLPSQLADLMDKPEAYTVLPNDQRRIERFIRARTRTATPERAAS